MDSCMACRAGREALEAYYRWFLKEYRASAATLEELAAGGFCREHAWELGRRGGELLNAPCEFLVTSELARLEALRGDRRSREPARAECPACREERRGAAYRLDRLAEGEPPAELPLCREHFDRLFALLSGARRERLLEERTRRARQLAEQFAAYFHALGDPGTDPSREAASAWRQALELLAGPEPGPR
ncbi:MAG: hypothetical protein M0031_06255 [Thermaerobacter sp.]|nr:hypothetical protein [Thermaerobacter sp.]